MLDLSLNNRHPDQLWWTKIDGTTVADRAEECDLSNFVFDLPATCARSTFHAFATYRVLISLRQTGRNAALGTLAPFEYALIAGPAEAPACVDAMRLQHPSAAFVT